MDADAKNMDVNHEFFLPARDIGPVPSEFINNFAWRTISIAPGNYLFLYDGNLKRGAAQYVEILTGVEISGTAVLNITGNGNNIYYAAGLPGNAYLAGKTYDLINGGRLIPVIFRVRPATLF